MGQVLVDLLLQQGRDSLPIDGFIVISAKEVMFSSTFVCLFVCWEFYAKKSFTQCFRI